MCSWSFNRSLLLFVANEAVNECLIHPRFVWESLVLQKRFGLGTVTIRYLSVNIGKLKYRCNGEKIREILRTDDLRQAFSNISFIYSV